MKQRSSFKVLLGDDSTVFDKNMILEAYYSIQRIIDALPERNALVRELSEATKMEPSRTRRLLNDLGIPTDWADYAKRGE